MSVLFNNIECLFLKPGIVVPEDLILLRTPRRNNTYIVEMNDPETKSSMACLLSKASNSESLLWHRRLGHVNFKNINRLVKQDLVRDPLSVSVNSTVTSSHSEVADTTPVNTSGDVSSGQTATVSSNVDQDLTNDPSVESDSDSDNNDGPIISDEILTNLPSQFEVADGPSFKSLSNHSFENEIGPTNEGDVPKNISMAMKDSSWIDAMQKELAQFRKLKGLPKKRELIIRKEAIRIFLAYACYKNFKVYPMDVKSAFVYGKVKEEVYVFQPLGFEDLDYPSRVYKLDKALYCLHQAPRACYDTLSS
ncbi:hypothetical protein L1987_18782 [Smallanthus sonchifolius]|uniref:Uncharacterized protein n=1 Tax=Smallanthus sonchifolius TaxID=185202 RepID=A0ACB9J3A0_9ASTR|nr:hypothetical protein L1987_18782 [Smallanthus sonchifolius]